MGGWFAFKKYKKEGKSKVLERVSIVTLDDTTNTRYVIFDVFKINAENGICHS